MPHFRFHAMTAPQVSQLSHSLLEVLPELFNSPKEDFTFECVASQFFFEGKPVDAYPFIELMWFDRGQDIQDKAAEIITQQCLLSVSNSADIAVIFKNLTPSAYYDNGKHY